MEFKENKTGEEPKYAWRFAQAVAATNNLG